MVTVTVNDQHRYSCVVELTANQLFTLIELCELRQHAAHRAAVLFRRSSREEIKLLVCFEIHAVTASV